MTSQDKFRIESMLRMIIIGTSGHPVNYCYLIIMNNYTVCCPIYVYIISTLLSYTENMKQFILMMF